MVSDRWGKPELPFQFSLTQWAAMATEPIMEPRFTWGSERNIGAIHAKLIEEDTQN